jgi:DNA (cytosine-5)-methyltransferase 1
MNYYNEWDSFAADWLRELIKDGLIPDGEVDNRSIADVRPEDLKGFTQCHFFAGIGGWSRALQLAGWSSDRPVWTGSPPCQSFSTAGKGKGKDDERHLWPVFFNLIRECQPPTVFGEQVAAAIRFGWLDDLQTDFEREGYASAAVVLPSGGIGAPHKRDRLFFMADSHNERHEWSQEAGRQARSGTEYASSFSMADSCGERCGGKEWGGEAEEKGQSERYGSERSSHSSVGNSEHDGSHEAEIGRSTGPGKAESGMLELERSDSLFWGSSEVIYCRDGKYRPIPTEPALFPLADGIPNRVGILRGAGNAIVPQAAAEIIKAYLS